MTEGEEKMDGQNKCCECKGTWLLVVIGVIIAVGVLLPLGIASWNAVVDHSAISESVKSNEAIGDKSFAKRDYGTALTAYIRARASRDSIDLQVKAFRAKAFLFATRPDLISSRDIADLEYERVWLLEKDPANAPTYLVVGGHIAAFKGDAETAAKAYQDALAKDPENPGAHMGLAIQAYRKGDAKKAQEEFAKVLEKIPDHIEALIGMGDVRLASGEADQAIEAYGKALKIQEDHRAHHGLGLAHVNKKNVEEAASEFQKAIALNPQAFDSYVALGNLLTQAGMLAQAERAFRGALAIRQDEGVLLNLAGVMNKMERYQDAIQTLFPLLQSRSAGPAVLLEAGKAMEGLGRKDDAKSYYQSAKDVLSKMRGQLDEKVIENLSKEIEGGLERISKSSETEKKE